MERGTLLAPCTAIDALSSPGLIERVYAGVGGEIRAWGSDGELKKCVFESHSIHGIKAIKNLNTVVAFGDKSVVLMDLDLNLNKNLSSMCNDMVLDCCIIAKADDTILNTLIGFAHNYVDILGLVDDRYSFLRRVLAPEACVLFSLHFSSEFIYEGQALTLASGNVFGKVTLWDFPFDVKLNSKGAKDAPTKTSAKMTLLGHEGVIFRIKWSPDKKYVATVADDRTIRIWDISLAHNTNGNGAPHNREIFVGWGHISRIWDVAFVQGEQPYSSVLVASASEDGTVKIWDFIVQQCLATLSGHQGDVWRLVSPMSGKYLLSGGNDCSIKLWNVSNQIRSCPDEQAASLTSYTFPSEAKYGDNTNDLNLLHSTKNILEVGIDKSRSDSKRKNGTSGLCVSPDSRFIIICLCCGDVWMIDRQVPVKQDTRPSSPSLFSQLGNWTSLPSLNAPVISTNAIFITDQDRKTRQCLLCSAHPDGSATFAIYQLNALNQNNRDVSKESFESEWTQESVCHWKAHEYRCTSVQILSPMKRTQISGGETKTALLLSVTIKGSFALWRVSNEISGNKIENHKTQCSEESTPHLVFRGSTQTSRRKGEMVTTACYLCTESNRGISGDFLIVGDIKGTISVFKLPVKVGKIDNTVVEPSQAVHRVHGVESISVIEPYLSGFLTGGGDGTLKRFLFYDENEEGNMGQIFQCTGEQSCLPVRIPLEIRVARGILDGDRNGHFLPRLQVGGFYASKYIVIDLTHSMTRLRVEGGSWRRPHHCIIGDDAVHLVSVAPTGANDCFVQEHFCPSIPPLSNDQIHRYQSSSTASAFGIMSVSHNGRVNYAAAFLCEGAFCVGGEEGKIKIYIQNDPCQSQSKSGYDPSGVHPMHTEGQVTLLEEVSLLGSAPVKVLCSATGRDVRILVGAGSRLSYSVWFYDMRSREGTLKDSVERGLSLAKHASYISDADTQEHRILCGKVLFSKVEDQFIVILGDSQGYVTPLIVEARKGDVTTMLPIEASAFPVLCCDMLSFFDGNSQLIVLGSSSGSIAIWSLHPKGTEQSESGLAHRKLTEYSAHSVGANCVSMRAWKTDRLRSDTDAKDEDSDHAFDEEWFILICSGGDDQAITLSICRVTFSYNSPSSIRCQVLLIVTADGAAGAALKGVHLRKLSSIESHSISSIKSIPELEMVTLAADQRVQRWRVKPSSIAMESSYMKLRSPYVAGSPFEWQHGMITFITDPQCMDCHDDEVVISGEGSQVMKLLD